MPTRDRRSGTERRETNRFVVEIDVEWVAASGRSTGSVSDVSLDGCFVLCSGDVENGEPIRLYIPLADGMKVEFTGRVANHVYEIGFGVKFDKLTAAQRELLQKLVARTERS